MSKSRRPALRSLTKKPAPRPRTGKQARHYHSELKAKAVKQGLCRQCYKKRGKSPSSIRCAACHAIHLQQAKKYRHDKVPQAVVKTRKARETGIKDVRTPDPKIRARAAGKRVLKHTPKLRPSEAIIAAAVRATAEGVATA